jgi:phenylacetic acid degradation protein PaaD
VADLPEGLRGRLDPVLREIAFARLVGVEIVEWAPGRATTRLLPDERVTNVHGAVHGAALFTLADTAFELACNGYGRVCVGLDVSIHYASPGSAGEELVAEAVEASRSRRVASYRVELRAGDAVRATVLATAFRTDRWHLGEDAWPAAWRQRH